MVGEVAVVADWHRDGVAGDFLESKICTGGNNETDATDGSTNLLLFLLASERPNLMVVVGYLMSVSGYEVVDFSAETIPGIH